MKDTEMPALKLTVNSIKKSFLNSGKRHIIITGSRKSGKTTLFNAITENKLYGITTYAVRNECVYLEENFSEEKTKIGIFDNSVKTKENKMRFVEGGFVTLGKEILEKCFSMEEDWFSVDEIGYLEDFCKAYCDLLEKLLDNKRMIAVLRKQDTDFAKKIFSRNDIFVVDTDKPFGNVGCVIMASGFGKRFGENKLMAPFKGRPLIENILDSTEEVFEKRVVVTRYTDIADLCKERKTETVIHNLPNKNDSIRFGIEKMQNVDGCMFCPADQPLLKRDTIMALALSAKNEPEYIWRLSYGEKKGTPVWFPKEYFSELCMLSENSGGNYIAERYPEKVKYLEVFDENELLDIDTREDLEILEKL